MNKKQCPICARNIEFIDYKYLRLLLAFTDRFGRIKKRYYTGVCLSHQKMLASAVKKAREMALLPFVK